EASADGEVVNGARVREREPFAVHELSVGGEAEDVERRMLRRERHAEVEQLTGLVIDLRVRAERGDLVQLIVEGVEPARLERRRIDGPRQPLLAEREQRAAERIDADVDRRLEADAALQRVAVERRAERAKDRTLFGVLRHVLRAADETVREVRAAAVETQR